MTSNLGNIWRADGTYVVSAQVSWVRVVANRQDECFVVCDVCGTRDAGFTSAAHHQAHGPH